MAIVAMTPQHGNKRSHADYVPGTIQRQSVYIGSLRAGQLLVYDKSKEDSSFPPDTIRFEQRGKTQLLRSIGIRSIADITYERLNSLMRVNLSYLLRNLTESSQARVARLISTVPHRNLALLIGDLSAQENGIRLTLADRDQRIVRKLRKTYDIASLRDLFAPEVAHRSRRIIPGYETK